MRSRPLVERRCPESTGDGAGVRLAIDSRRFMEARVPRGLRSCRAWPLAVFPGAAWTLPLPGADAPEPAVLRTGLPAFPRVGKLRPGKSK
jgi:hypothetical protein